MTTNTSMQLTANPTEIVNFHGLSLFVYSTESQNYIPIKPITDLVGIDWRNVKRSITQGDNSILYGTKRIFTTKIDNLGGGITPQTALNSAIQTDIEQKNEQNEQLTDLLCIQLDRVQMFLARINTSKVRSQGNIHAADYILKLQMEWAQVLHDYETHGIAVKRSLFDNAKHLKTLADVYHKLDDKQQRYLVSKQIDAALNRQPQQPEGQADLF